jgi:hypothetical protein
MQRGIETTLPDLTAPAARWFKPALYAVVIFRALPVLSVAGFYVAFILRNSFTYGDRRIHTLFDDAMISMRYARNLAEGHGLVWNPGEAPVEGYTNLLWTLWMSVLHLMRFPETSIGLVVALTGAAMVVLTAFVATRIARRLYPENRLAHLVAFWGTLTYYPLVFWSLRGMEVGLLALLLSTAVLLTLRLRQSYSHSDLAWLALVTALGLLTRQEFLVPALVTSAFAVHGCRDKRLIVGSSLALVVLATMGGLTIFRIVYYDSLLPNTYYLKMEGVDVSVRVARGIIVYILTAFTHLGGLLLLMTWYVLHKRLRLVSGEALLLLTFASLSAYSLWVGGDAWEDFRFTNRYVAPAVPLLLVVSVTAMQAFVATAKGTRLVVLPLLLLLFALINLGFDPGRRAPAAELLALGAVLMAVPFALPALSRFKAKASQNTGWAAVALVLMLLALNFAHYGHWLVKNSPHTDGDIAVSAYGLLLRQTTGPDATLAVTWAGAPSYFSHRNTFDQLGKADPVIARGPNVRDNFLPGHTKWNFAYTIGQLRPDYVAAVLVVTPQDIEDIKSWGYEELTNTCFVRSDSQLVDREALRRGIVELQSRFPGFLCESLDEQ